MKGYATIGLLILSNIFMTLAWYGHLKFKELKWFENAGLITIILISWDWHYSNIVSLRQFEQSSRVGFLQIE